MFHSRRLRYDHKAMGSHVSFELGRLTPTMRSRRLQALTFIRQYVGRFGGSPSLGEIGAELDVSRQHASRIVGRLEKAGLVRRIPGQARGIELTKAFHEVTELEAIAALRAAGWQVNPGEVTKGQLPKLPHLDHDPS